MKYYYIDNMNSDLVVYDTETEELQVIERHKNVRVRLETEIEEHVPEEEVDIAISQGKSVRKRRIHTCKKCGRSGHRSDSDIYHPRRQPSDKDDGIS